MFQKDNYHRVVLGSLYYICGFDFTDEQNQLVQEADKQFKQTPNEDLSKEGCKCFHIASLLFVVTIL